MGGFESSCHRNGKGQRLDMVAATHHDRRAHEDYLSLRGLGLATARDAIRWPLIEREGRFDFRSFLSMLDASQRAGVQIIWDIFHFGWPDDVDIFSSAFVMRFARLCREVAKLIRRAGGSTPCFAVMNEISFFAWAAAEIGWFYPYVRDRGGELKRNLIRATIAGINEIWSVDRSARIVHTDPILNVVSPVNASREEAQEAAIYHCLQYEAWDALAGKAFPELGGNPVYLDIVGANFYHANQFEYHGNRIKWEDEPRDPRWLPLSIMLKRIAERYGRPIVITETGHFGAGRGRWIVDVAANLKRARDWGVALEGVCLYPIIDRPDWDDLDHWHNSGLLDITRESSGELTRSINQDYARAIEEARSSIR
jgi:beta-glucosidase/6-phospho-beta-glucosidase/beta-galactosidase